MFGDIQLHPEVEIESAHDHDHKILQENNLQMTLDDNFHAADSNAAPVVTCWSLPTSCQELSGDVGSSLATQIGRFDVENLES